MPATNVSRRNIKTRKPKPKRTYPNRRPKRSKGVLGNRKPRFALRKSPFGRANSYPFTRSVTEYIDAWASSPNINFHLNADSTYYVMNMNLKFTDLPDVDEFRTLFTRYKITSWKTQITPSFKENVSVAWVADSSGSAGQIQPAIPNLEMFIIPATYTVKPATRDWTVLNYADITDILNQTQIKARRVVPSKGFTFLTKHPKIVKTGFMPAKQNSVATDTETYLGTAPWLTNGEGPHHTGPALDDQRTVIHYGYTILVRRVDGLPMTTLQPLHPAGTYVARMGWRVTRQAYFKLDKVR